MRLLIIFFILFATNSVFAQVKKEHLSLAAKIFKIDLDNKFIKERFYNFKKREELIDSLVFKEVKYIKGNIKEKRLSEKELKKRGFR